MDDQERRKILQEDTFKNISDAEFRKILPVLKRLTPSQLLAVQCQAKADRTDDSTKTIDSEFILEK